MKLRWSKSLWAAAVLLLFSLPAAAQSPAPPAEKPALLRWAEQDYMFGNWGGWRPKLKERGVDFEFLYAGAVPINLDGGLRDGAVYEGVLAMMLNVDSEKLGLWKNGTFRASSLYLHSGDAFSPNYVGDLNQVSLLDFPDSFRLWELWYEHKLFDQRVALKAGQLDIGQDFIVPEFYNSFGSASFFNQTFFYPTMAFNVWDQRYFPVGHHGLASTPYGAPGVRLRYDPIPQVYGQFGAYDGLPDRSFTGTRINLNSAEGALMYFELGWKRNQEKDASGPPGNIKLGGWYHTDDFFDEYQASFVAFDNYSVANGGPALGLVTNPKTYSGNYGAYVLADHVLWRERQKDDPANQGLAGFLRGAVAPKDRNLAHYSVDGGLVYRGLIPSRDWDTFGVAASYMRISDELRNAQRDISSVLDGVSPGLGSLVPRADYEAVVELNYKAQLTAWWTLSASFQRVIHPGGRVAAETPDASVLILQALFRF